MKNRYYHVTYQCVPLELHPAFDKNGDRELQKIEIEIYGEKTWEEAYQKSEVRLRGIIKPGTNYKLTGVYSHVE